jgi:hypothetical protein
MQRDNQLTMPPAPNLIGAIRSGFDAIANNILLILFPIALDLFLWIGPRLRLTDMIKSISDQIFKVYSSQDPGLMEIIQPIQEVWSGIAEHFNLWAALRTYPVGITSLMVSRMPKTSPLGLLAKWELYTLGNAFIAFVLISIIGIAFGTLYFSVVGQAAVGGEVSWRSAFNRWPWASLQMLFLAILFLVFIFFISIPASFILSFVLLSGISFGSCILFVFAGFIFWMILPLVFAPHGIVLNQNSFFSSLKVSTNLIRKTLPTTVLFILVIFLLSKGLDILWVVPAESSWIMLIGILGHAFITTGLLASSFVYYRDALSWIQGMVRVQSLSKI